MRRQAELGLQKMKKALLTLIAAGALVACEATTPQAKAPGASMRGVHSGERDRINYYYELDPTCQSRGYPEITVIKAPMHGSVSTGQGEDYPNFARDNVRYECNTKRVAVTEIFYQSNADFHGSDAFTISVRYPNSNLQTISYVVEVR